MCLPTDLRHLSILEMSGSNLLDVLNTSDLTVVRVDGNLDRCHAGESLGDIFTSGSDDCLEQDFGECDSIYGLITEIIKDCEVRDDIAIQSIQMHIPEGFFVSGVREGTNGQVYFMYSAVKTSLFKPVELKNRIAVLAYGGYGDAAMMLPVLQYLIKDQAGAGCEVVVISTSNSVCEIFERYLENCIFLLL